MRKTKLLSLAALAALILLLSACPPPGGSTSGSGSTPGGGASDTSKPVAPSNLTYVNVNASSVKFSWQDNSGNETGFRLYATSLLSDAHSTIDVPGANITTFTVTGLDSYGYVFDVSAYNANGESDPSSAITVTVGAPIAAPTNLRTTSVGATSVSLAWDQNSSDCYYFSIERSTTSDTAGFLQTTTSGSPSCTDPRYTVQQSTGTESVKSAIRT